MTPNLELPTVPSNSLQPSVPINASLQILDALVQCVVQDKDLSAPPTTTDADAGKLWIVGPAPTGAWAGHAEDLALSTAANLWMFIEPKEGWRASVIDEANDAVYRFTGSGGWVIASAPTVWGSITGTLSAQTDLQAALDEKAPLAIPQNSQSSAYTLVLSDSGKHIFHPSADTTGRTWTIPANSSVAFPIGTAVTFVNQNGAGTITLAITTDIMRLAGPGTTGSRTLAANGIATALKVTSTEWIISGTGLS